MDSMDSTVAAQDLRNRREGELQDMKRQLEESGKSHEQTIQDLRHKHNSAVETLNDQLDTIKKVGPVVFPLPKLIVCHCVSGGHPAMKNITWKL